MLSWKIDFTVIGTSANEIDPATHLEWIVDDKHEGFSCLISTRALIWNLKEMTFETEEILLRRQLLLTHEKNVT